TPANWQGNTNGNWTDPTRWDTNPSFPNNGTPAGATYAATLATPGNYTVTLNSAATAPTFSINNHAATLGPPAAAHHTYLHTAALSQGTLRMTGGTLTGGSLTSSGGKLVADNSSTNILSGVQVGANVLDLSADNTILRLLNGTNFTALNTFALGGNSVLRVEQ